MSSRLAFILSLIVAVSVAGGVVLARERVAGEPSAPASVVAADVSSAAPDHRNPPVSFAPTPETDSFAAVVERRDHDEDDDYEDRDHDEDDHDEDDD